MRIALFSDIHANLPAFKSILNDIDNQKPNASYAHRRIIFFSDTCAVSQSQSIIVYNEYLTVTSINPINLQTIICNTQDKGIFMTKDGNKNWNHYTERLTNENF